MSLDSWQYLVFYYTVNGFIIYLILAYVFFVVGWFNFMRGEHPFAEKWMETAGCVFTPPFLPVVLLGWLSYRLGKFMVQALLFALGAVTYPVYCLVCAFPLGGIFRAWCQLSGLILEKIRQKMAAWLGQVFPGETS
jgi:hypothetical protein